MFVFEIYVKWSIFLNELFFGRKINSFHQFQWDLDPNKGSRVTLAYIRITWNLLKHRLLGPASRISDTVRWEWGPRIFILNKFPNDTDVDWGYTLRTTGIALENSLLDLFLFSYIMYILQKYL